MISLQTRDVDDVLAPGDDLGARLLGGSASNGRIGQAAPRSSGAVAAAMPSASSAGSRCARTWPTAPGTEIVASALDIANGLVKLGYEPNPASRVELSGSLYRDEGTVPVNGNALSDPATDVARDADVATARLGWSYRPAGSELIDLSALGYYNGSGSPRTG